MRAEIAYALLGAALVLLGVWGGALADRIRHGRQPRERSERRDRKNERELAEVDRGAFGDDPIAVVVSALVNMGYGKPEAKLAASSVHVSDRSTPATWLRAACRALAPAVKS